MQNSNIYEWVSECVSNFYFVSRFVFCVIFQQIKWHKMFWTKGSIDLWQINSSSPSKNQTSNSTPTLALNFKYIHAQQNNCSFHIDMFQIKRQFSFHANSMVHPNVSKINSHNNLVLFAWGMFKITKLQCSSIVVFLIKITNEKLI